MSSDGWGDYNYNFFFLDLYSILFLPNYITNIICHKFNRMVVTKSPL